MTRWLTTFPDSQAFEMALKGLEQAALAAEVIRPEPKYRLVGAPALVVDDEGRDFLGEKRDLTCSGWVEYRPTERPVPDEEPPIFSEDVFGRAAIMVLAPCVADETRIRLIAHITGDMAEVFPYLNAVMETASYIKSAPVLTFMDGYRMISLSPRRITVARADEIVDAWRVLEMIRYQVNRVWQQRATIQPSDALRQRPPALEILKRLPRTNCRACGEPTCTAFACKVYEGASSIEQCKAVFGGKYGYLKEALLEVCRGLGAITEKDSVKKGIKEE